MATTEYCECKRTIGKFSFKNPETGKTICPQCALKIPLEKWKSEETRSFLLDLQSCREHRASMKLPDNDMTTLPCGPMFTCAEGCPVPDRQHDKPIMNSVPNSKMITKGDLDKCRDRRHTLKLVPENDISNLHCDQRVNNGIKCWADCPVPSRYPDNMTVVSASVGNTKPKKELKPEKENFPSREVESFLNLQIRVLEKLAWHPRLWKLLDKFSSSEIEERLEGKSGLEAVPKTIGGQMKFKASDKTKQMFETLEKKFEDEDAKTGKKPYNIATTHAEQAEQSFGFGDGNGDYSMRWYDEPPERTVKRDIECPTCHHTQSPDLEKCEVCGQKLKEGKKDGKKHKE